jgi:hypothetical protein
MMPFDHMYVTTNKPQQEHTMNKSITFPSTDEIIALRKADYVKCISTPLSYDVLEAKHKQATGRNAAGDRLFQWAIACTEWFYICPEKNTVHAISYAKPLK